MRRDKSLTLESLEDRVLLSDLTASLTTSKSVYTPGEAIQMTFRFTNYGDQPASFVDGPSFDGFTVTQDGKTAWQSNAGINPAIAFVQTIQPGQSMSFDATWNGTTGAGSSVSTADGTFEVTNQLDPAGPSATFEIESQLLYSSSVSQSNYQVGQPIDFSYTITNISDQPAPFALGPIGFNITSNGALIWVSDPGPLPQFVRQETLPAGQSLTYTATWNGVANMNSWANTNVWDEFGVSVSGAPPNMINTFQIESPLTQSVTTNQTTYQVGQPIQFTATETNTSDQAITILNANDVFNVIGNGGVTLPATNLSSSNPVVTLQPGQTQTFVGNWNPATATGTSAAPSGSYKVEFSDRFQSTTSPPFVIDGQSVAQPTITASLATSDVVSTVGKPVRIKITLTNVTTSSMKLTPNAHTDGVTVLRGSTVISRTTKSLLTPKAKALKPGKSLVLATIWNGKPNQAGVRSIKPGDYMIEVDEGGFLASTVVHIK